MNPKNFDEMVARMLLCEQTKGQSVYQHGRSVWKHFCDLLDFIKGDYTLPNDEWKLPDWLKQYSHDILANLHNEELIREYATYHDCGKPYCRIEENGRVHFPNHAEVSKQVWLSVGGNPIVANLIGWDMDLHTLNSVEIEQRCQEWSINDICTLLLVALSEIHSNARMFGGINSDSFKIKWKQLERRGRQICKTYFGEKKCVITKR